MWTHIRWDIDSLWYNQSPFVFAIKSLPFQDWWKTGLAILSHFIPNLSSIFLIVSSDYLSV